MPLPRMKALDTKLSGALGSVSASNLVQHNVKLSRTANCFFAVVLFSAGAAALAQVRAGRANGPSEGRPDDLPNMQTKDFGLVTHGGAGTIERSKMTPEREREYRAGIERGLSAGYEILQGGGTNLEAAEAVVRVFQVDPTVNACRSAVVTDIGSEEVQVDFH